MPRQFQRLINAKLATTHATSGLLAPTFMIVSGLDYVKLNFDNKKNFIESKCVHALKVKGLSMNSSRDPSNEKCRHIIFQRKPKGKEYNSDASRVKICREKVLNKFIKDMKKAMNILSAKKL